MMRFAVLLRLGGLVQPAGSMRQTELQRMIDASPEQ